MKLKFWEKEQTENRATTYGDSVVAAILASASGGINANAYQSAAVEFAAGLIERSFAVAGVNPPDLAETLTPSKLSLIARRLVLTGNSVLVIDNANGATSLIPATSFTMEGGIRESTWRYHCTLSGPSKTEVRILKPSQVIHVKMGATPAQPWMGCSPLQNAGISAEMLGRVETRMDEESNARVGYLLAIPDGVSDESKKALKSDLGTLKGGIALTETGSAGHGQGARNAPQQDWLLRRFGAEFPMSNVQLRMDISNNICSALGVPSALFSGSDGQTIREMFRQLLVGTLQPMAALIGTELEEKLGRAVSFDFVRLQAADIASRARAYGVMIQSGVDDDEARRISGLVS